GYGWSVRQGTSGISWATSLASVLLAMGDLVEAEAVVRTGLAPPGFARSEALIRLQAGVLALRRGTGNTARGHLARAQELVPDIQDIPEDEPCIPIAEILSA